MSKRKRNSSDIEVSEIDNPRKIRKLKKKEYKKKSGFHYFADKVKSELINEKKFMKIHPKTGKNVPDSNLVKKEVSRRWKEASPATKARFKKIAKKNNVKEEEIPGLEKPKKPPTAFFLFMKEHRDKVQKRFTRVKKNGEIGPDITKASKEMGKMWRNLSKEKKKPLLDIEAARRKVYEKEMTVYNKKAAEYYEKREKELEAKRLEESKRVNHVPLLNSAQRYYAVFFSNMEDLRKHEASLNGGSSWLDPELGDVTPVKKKAKKKTRAPKKKKRKRLKAPKKKKKKKRNEQKGLFQGDSSGDASNDEEPLPVEDDIDIVELADENNSNEETQDDDEVEYEINEADRAFLVED